MYVLTFDEYFYVFTFVFSLSNEGAVMMPHDEGNKSETEVSDTKVSENSASSFDYKSFQDLTIIETDTPLLDSGSERCVIDSDSDRGIGLDSDLEQHSKDSDSVLWETDLGSEKCPMGSDSVKHLLEAEKFQMASGSAEDLMESEQHLIGAEQRQLDFYSLKHWMDSDSEKCLADSDSEKYMTDSDNERPRIDSDSEKYPMASASVKHLWKAEKCQMASDSIKRLMESERRLMETEQNWILSASKKYVVDSHMERDGIDSASASGILLMEEEKHQEKTRSERYMMGSDSEPCTTDSDSKRYSLASASVKCLMDAKTFQLSTDTERHWMDSWSERHTMDLNSESLGMASDSVKHMMKAESCQRASDWERFWIGLRSESESCWVDSERQQLDFDCGRYLDRSRRYQHRSSGHQGSSRRCQDDLQKHWDDFEKHQLESDSEKHQANLENERYKNEFESERHMLETEREQCLIQSENERFQMGEERGKYLIMSDSEKEHQIVSDKERHHPDLESEAQRLGARRKDNRPQAVSRIQLVRYLNDDKIVRFKEVSPTLSDKQYSQQKVKEKHSCNIFPDPNTFMDNKHHRNARRKVSVCKCRYTDYRYQQSFQSSRSQINPIHLLSAEDYTSEVSAPVCHPTSIGPWSAVHPKTHRSNTYALDTGAPVCSKCFVEINNSPFHKCLVNSGNDSNPDCPLHLQTLLDSKYSLSLKSIRHRKTFQNSPLSRSLDPKHPVGIRSPLHQEDSKHSLGSTSYLHCESCSALRNLIGSTVTHNFPRNPQNNIGHHKILGPDNVISTSDVAALESEDKFNFTAKLENEAKPDNETKLVGSDDLKDKANAKDKLLLKVETDHEDETDSEDEKDPEDETDPEDEDNTKDKKDPEDKSDPDNTDPKDSNAEKDADTNSGSDPSGDADPTSGADSNSDGDSNNGTDSNNEPDSNIDNATNNDANSKYSTDSEEDKHINSLDNASGLDNSVYQDCTADFNNDSNPNYTSEFQNGTDLDYTSGYSNGADLSTGSSNDTGPKNGPGPNINGSGIQKNGPGPQNIRPDPNSPGPSNNGSSPSIHDLGPSNSPDTNNNSPGPSDNIPGLINTSPDLQKDSDSNYNARPNNATSHNIAISPTKDGNSIYETKPISAAGHNFAANPNSDSNLDYGPGFTHGVGSNFVVNPNFIDSYADCLSSTVSTVNVTDTRNTTSCTGAISLAYTAGTNCASDTNRDPRFTHVIGSNFVINSNYDATNTHNVHNSIRTSNGNNLSEPELEINSSSSIPNVFYGNSPIFAVGTNYISTPEKLTTSKFSNPSKLDRNYTIFDDHKFGACLKDSAGAMDSASFKDATESKDVPDAKESGFLDDFSEFQYPIGIKDPASLNLHSNSNIPLPSFDIIVEAEPPDVVKFAISSGAVNQFFKKNKHLSKGMGAGRIMVLSTVGGLPASLELSLQEGARAGFCQAGRKSPQLPPRRGPGVSLGSRSLGPGMRSPSFLEEIQVDCPPTTWDSGCVRAWREENDYTEGGWRDLERPLLDGWSWLGSRAPEILLGHSVSKQGLDVALEQKQPDPPRQPVTVELRLSLPCVPPP
ncbi:hypothetical protein CB1_001127001 [Camelus ferus]|nr:hypothetical protein CB1_001127001 [Camelus ferus]